MWCRPVADRPALSDHRKRHQIPERAHRRPSLHRSGTADPRSPGRLCPHLHREIRRQPLEAGPDLWNHRGRHQTRQQSDQRRAFHRAGTADSAELTAIRQTVQIDIDFLLSCEFLPIARKGATRSYSCDAPAQKEPPPSPPLSPYATFSMTRMIS